MSISAKIHQLDQTERALWDNMNTVFNILTKSSQPIYTNKDILYMVYAINNLHRHRVLLQDRKFSGCFLFLTRDMPALMQSFTHFLSYEYVHEYDGPQDASVQSPRITRSMAAFHMQTIEHYKEIAEDITCKVNEVVTCVKGRSQKSGVKMTY